MSLTDDDFFTNHSIIYRLIINKICIEQNKGGLPIKSECDLLFGYVIFSKIYICLSIGG